MMKLEKEEPGGNRQGSDRMNKRLRAELLNNINSFLAIPANSYVSS